jgi:ABC-type transport system involved in multi-copper enzyme maturation permease subunit
MTPVFNATTAEFLKIKRSKIVLVSFIAFSIAPVMGAIFMNLLKHPQAVSDTGALRAKALAMNFSADWNAYLVLLTQSISVGGILIFGFVASWIFGREYSENTAKDLLALPTSRTAIINGKFIVYLVWSFTLAVSNLLTGFLIGSFLRLPALEKDAMLNHLVSYFITTLLTLLPGSTVALMAIWGRGYLAPLGFVALVLVLAQVIAATGYGNYFPWSVPGLFSGAAGEYKKQLNEASYIILFVTAIGGYLATIAYWKYSDQTK